jgi:hypothetical protein
MKEGTVPVPPYRPCAYCDDDVLPVQGVIASGEALAVGGETPVSVQVFSGNISRETKIILQSITITLPWSFRQIFATAPWQPPNPTNPENRVHHQENVMLENQYHLIYFSFSFKNVEKKSPQE